MSEARVRRARPAEADQLSELALRSKAHWGYDEAFMAASRAELTVTRAAVRDAGYYVAESEGKLLGFYGIARLDQGEADLVHLFVDPPEIGHGHGALLLRHAAERARSLGHQTLVIDADPNAEGFYLALGALRTGLAPSGSIPGRQLPQLRLAL